ncbi:MAG: tRNA pseudouridine(38-40) synthase TruA [Bacteroidales bacterium]|nr:tRNA pseudouridine(38-40) synthase TruA [Bacteroidales bacterium]
MRYSIKLSFDGSGFSGWQKQNNAVSVQGELSRALAILLGEPAEVTGAGRTDAGVNAINYIAHFDSSRQLSENAAHMRYKLNAILPKGIVIHEISAMPEDFHARFTATSREYHYFIHRVKDPFSDRFSYLCRYPLDIEKMNEAAAYLLGRHDFRCFEKAGSDNATSLCTVFEARWESYSPSHCSIMGFPCREGDYIVFRIRANRFLRNMVRAIVGTLVDVGRGKREPSWVKELIEGGTRSDAGESVPGKALFLTKVDY